MLNLLEQSIIIPRKILSFCAPLFGICSRLLFLLGLSHGLQELLVMVYVFVWLVYFFNG